MGKKEKEKRKNKKNKNKKNKDINVNRMKNTSRKNNKSSKKGLKIFARILLVIIIIVVILLIVFKGGIFKVKEIDITINGKESDQEYITIREIEEASSLRLNENVFSISRGKIKSNISENLYVESIEVKKPITGKVKIDVKTKDVAYILNYAGLNIYIDNKGNVLDISDVTEDVPILIGLTTDFTDIEMGNISKGTCLNEDDLKALDVVNNIMDEARSNFVDALITRIDINDLKNVILYLDSEFKTVYLGDCQDLTTRILYMKDIIKEESGIQGEIYINGDLNSSYVYFRETV